MRNPVRPLTGIVVAFSALVAFTMGAFAPALASSSGGTAAGNVARDAAVIVDPGDGDHSGFRIVVTPDDRANAVDGAGHASGEVPSQLTDAFFADLRTGASSGEHAFAGCTGTGETQSESAFVTVAWKNHIWKHAGCSSDPATVRVADDAVAIARALYVQRYRMRPMYVYLGNDGKYVFTGQQAPNIYGTAYKGVTQAGGYSGQAFTSFGGYSASPYTGYPPGSMPSGSLPLASIAGSLPSGSLPGSSPYTGLPSASLPSSSPFDGSPYGSSPYCAGP